MIDVVHVLCDLAGGGAERLVLDLCRRVPGARSRVVTVYAGGALAGAFAREGVRVTCAGRVRKRLGLRATLRIAQALQGADVVHTHLWAGDTWGRLAALSRPGLPVVTTEHNVEPEPGRWRALVDAPLQLRTTRFVAVSEASAAALRQRGVADDRIQRIDNGVDLARLRPRRPLPEPPVGGPHVVLGVGRLTRQKGFDLLIDALAGLPVALTLVGEGEAREALAARARQRGVLLRLPGWLPDPWAVPAHLVVMPSRWEGFGLTAVEALASALPLVTSDAAPLPRLVADAAVVAPRTVAGLREAVRAVLADPGRRAALSHGGRDRARAFSLDRTAAAHAQLYGSLVAAARRRA